MRKKQNKITACMIAASMCLAMPAELGWCLTVNAENEETEWNGHRYRIIEEEMNPSEAEAYCEALGGHLVTITSQEEQDRVAELVSRVDYENFWIGASDEGSEGEWYWMNGEPWGYTAWYPGGSAGSEEPNNGLGDGENYAMMNWERAYQWIDSYGGYDNYAQTAYFVCEWDEDASASLQVTIGGGTEYLVGTYADVPLTITGNIPDDAWITFVPSDVPHNEKDGDDANEPGKYQRLKDVENGIAHFEAPSKNGAYDIRVYDGDDPDTAREIAYKTVEIVYADMTASVRVDSNVIKPGEEIRVYVEYSGLVRNDAWVGFIPSDVAHTEKDSDDHNGDWGWVYEADETGYVLITAPTRTGTWDIRLFDGDGAYAKEVTYITVTVSEDAEPVEAGSKTTWNGHTYQYFNTGMSWDEAEAYCESLGGHLANIADAEENQVIFELVNGAGKPNYWVGGKLFNETWVWVPSNDDISYNGWRSGEPNNANGIEDRVMMYSEDGTWNDLQNDSEYDSRYGLTNMGFVCEWDDDIPQGLTRSAFSRIEAEDYQDASPRVHSAANYGTGTCIGWITDGYYIAYEAIDFGTGAKSAIISASNYYDCVIEIRLDSEDGTLIGTCSIPGIANWNSFSEYTCNVSSVSGIHDVYLVCRADTTVDVTNLDYFTFSKKSAAETPTEPPTTEPPATEPADAKEMPGDVNLDGTVDIMDVISINRYLLGSNKLGPVAKKNADVDGSNTIDTTDSLLILKYVVEIIDSFGTEPTQPTEATEPTSPPVSSELGTIVSTYNTAAVESSPTEEATFTVDQVFTVYSIMTYHWNNGEGTESPGKIALLEDGVSMGNWQTVGEASAYNAPNNNWLAYPIGLVLRPGHVYTVVDSDPDTWSYNASSQNAGFFEIKGYAGASETEPTEPAGGTVDFTGVKIQKYQERVPANSNAFVELDLSGNTDLSGSDAWLGLIPVGTGTSELEADAVDIAYTYLNDATYQEDDHISVGVFVPQGTPAGEYELRVYANDSGGALVDRVTITVIEENTLTFRREEIGWYMNDDGVPCLSISFDYTGEILKGSRVRIMFVPAGTPHDDWASVDGMGGQWASAFQSAGGDYTSVGLPDKTEGEWELRAYSDVFNGARELDSMPIPAYDLD